MAILLYKQKVIGKKGKLFPFDKKLIVKYQRSGEGSDR